MWLVPTKKVKKSIMYLFFKRKSTGLYKENVDVDGTGKAL